jgi:hypothetical protein
VIYYYLRPKISVSVLSRYIHILVDTSEKVKTLLNGGSSVFLENAKPRYKDKATYLNIQPRQNRTRFAFTLQQKFVINALFHSPRISQTYKSFKSEVLYKGLVVQLTRS